MKKLLALLAISLLASAAVAQMDPDADGIGIYFDEGGNEVCAATSAPFSLVNAYLLITRPSVTTGVSGWEGQVTAMGFTAPAFNVPGIDAITGDNDPDGDIYAVGIGTGQAALPYGDTVVLGSFEGYVLAPADVATFHIGPRPGSGSDMPMYGAGHDAGMLVPLNISAHGIDGDYTTPVAQVNGTCTVVGNEDMTFSNVKSLFR